MNVTAPKSISLFQDDLPPSKPKLQVLSKASYLTFEGAQKLFDENNLQQLSSTLEGQRYLLLKSMARPEYLKQLALFHQLNSDAKTKTLLMQDIFESNKISNEQIVHEIQIIYQRERASRLVGEEALLDELAQITSLSWGGLYQNTLEQAILDLYVKKTRSLQKLKSQIVGEMYSRMEAFAISSWYNHQAGIIIEDLFNDHPNVLPAVGKMDKIDFFINETPFDLKITYLPENYIKQKRKALNLPSELSVLKKSARQNSLPLPPLPDAALMEYLWKKLSSVGTPEVINILEKIKQVRELILNECSQNPEELICWLYENQGFRRFDSSNRIYLVLYNPDCFMESWRIKSQVQIVKSAVHSYLNSATSNPGKDIEFEWNGEKHSCLADLIIVKHSLAPLNISPDWQLFAGEDSSRQD